LLYDFRVQAESNLEAKVWRLMMISGFSRLNSDLENLKCKISQINALLVPVWLQKTP
jgi:hypothetical protein